MGTIREVPKQDGSVSFHAEVRLKGHLHQRSSHRTRTLAKKWIQDIESAIRDGRHFRTAEAKKHTVGELIDRFIREWVPKYPKYQRKQKALLLWWKGELEHLLLADLNASQIAAARDKLLAGITCRKSQRSPGTVNRYLAALSKALTVAVKEWQWLENNPMRKVSKPSESKGRNRFLSQEEVRRLLDVCKKSQNPYLYSVVRIALISGMRYGEIINLRWEDINFEQSTVTLQITKNGERRVIPLVNGLETAFKECSTFGAPKNEYVFPARHRASEKAVGGIRYAFVKAVQAAELKLFVFHDLRHTAASHMAMNGATQGELMCILGHFSPHMTRRYSHYSQKHIASLMERTQINLLKEATRDPNQHS